MSEQFPFRAEKQQLNGQWREIAAFSTLDCARRYVESWHKTLWLDALRVLSPEGTVLHFVGPVAQICCDCGAALQPPAGDRLGECLNGCRKTEPVEGGASGLSAHRAGASAHGRSLTGHVIRWIAAWLGRALDWLIWVLDGAPEHRGLISPQVREILDDPERAGRLMAVYHARKRREAEAWKRGYDSVRKSGREGVASE